MKTHAYQRHEKRKSESDSKKSSERASRKMPSYPKNDDTAGNGAQDNDAAAEAENQGDNEDNEDGEDTSQEGEPQA